jgi:TatD DNase family protein
MELVDTHCHLTFESLASTVEQVLERSIAAGVTRWITVGTGIEDSIKAVELANRYDNLYAAIGIHPHDAKDADKDSLVQLQELAQSNKVVAIGETGLDFHYNFSKQQTQQNVFIEHLKLAYHLNLPVIIHSRNAFEKTIEILDQFGSEHRKMVFHCFSGNAEQAKKIVDKGFFISYTGVVTFKNAKTIRESVKVTPIERMMLETDCPYMSPEPMRKQKINEPALMVHTAKLLADVKTEKLENLAQITTNTAIEFFNLKK